MIVGVVNRHRVGANRKLIAAYSYDEIDLMPPLRISDGRYGKPTYYNLYEFTNMSGRFIYNYKRPLPCGATCWFELDEITDKIKKS